MRKIDRYISTSFVGGCIPVLVLLLSLFGVLSLSEELEDVGEGSYRLADALLVVAFSLPALAVTLLPVTVLLGGLLGLGALANNLELISMRAAAISPARLAIPIIRLAVVLVAVVVCLQTWVIPEVAHKTSQLRTKTLIAPGPAGQDKKGGAGAQSEFWTRNNGQFIRIGQVQSNRSLADVEIYQFDERGNLSKLLQTPRAEFLQGNIWLLHQVQETRLGDEHLQSQTNDTLLWDSLLSEEQTHRLITPASSLAPADLWQSIQRLEENNMNSESHRIQFWTQMSISLGLPGMALLALPFLMGSARSVPVGKRIAIGGLIGITYYLAQQISGHLAGIYHWNVALTILAPGLLILCIAVVLIKRAN